MTQALTHSNAGLAQEPERCLVVAHLGRPYRGPPPGLMWSVVSGTTGKTWMAATNSLRPIGADSEASMGAFVAGEEQSYYRYRPDLSLSKETFPPVPLISVTHYTVEPAAANDFIEGIKKVNEG